MAMLLHDSSTDTIDLSEMITLLETDLHLHDEESLTAAAPLLKRLANNRSFLAQFIASTLRPDAERAHPLSRFAEPSLTLYDGSDVQLRAVFWFPPELFPPSRRWQAKNLSYLQAHDHERSFLTVGYLGPGYTTHLFEYDPLLVKGVPGEHVALQECASQEIGEGQLMLYQESRDVHIQDHPKDFSVTLNIALKRRRYTKPQTLFDLETKTVSHQLFSELPYAGQLLDIAAEMPHPEVSTAIETLARTHRDDAVRIKAWENLYKRDRANRAYCADQIDALRSAMRRSASANCSK